MGALANAASVAILRPGVVLLIRRARPPFVGAWTLPGGRCEPGEAPEAAARREVGEELGLVLGGLGHLTTFEAAPGWRLAVFAASDPGGEVHPSDEVGAWGWMTREAAASLETTPGLHEVLAMALREDGARD